jgi:hypothetical protein
MLQATTKTVPSPSVRLPLLLGVWLVLGSTLAVTGTLRHVPQVAPAFLAASVLTFAIAYLWGGAIRQWADALPMRAVIAAHALRLPIGAAFLWEASGGTLSPMFAQRAGWGDIAVGSAAIAVALFAWRERRVVRAFAWFGLVDILIALGTGMYLLLGVQDPLMLSAIARLPYPLLPLVVVPLVILTHLLMLARTRR